MDFEQLLEMQKLNEETKQKFKLMVKEKSFSSNKLLLHYNMYTLKSIYSDIKSEDLDSKKDSILFYEKIYLNLCTLNKLITEKTTNLNDEKLYDFNSICSISRNIIETISQFDAIFTKSKDEEEVNFNLLIFKYTYKSQRFRFLNDKNIVNKPFKEEAKKELDLIDKEVKEHILFKRSFKYKDLSKFNYIQNGKFYSLTLTELIDNIIGNYGIYSGYKPKFYKFISSESHTTFGVLDYFKYSPKNEQIERRLNYIINILLQYLKCLLLSMSSYYKIENNSYFELLKTVYLLRANIKDDNF